MLNSSLKLVGLIFSWGILTGMSKPPVISEPQPVEEPEIGSCDQYNPLKNPHFGDLHIHTGFSMDAAQNGAVNTPHDAYAFAKGEPVALPPYDANGNSDRIIQLERPLDFAGVTDHSEFLAETNLCFNRDSWLYYGAYCSVMRGTPEGGTPLDSIAFALGLGGSVIPGGEITLSMCKLHPELCGIRDTNAWKEIQNAAHAAYDTSTRCSFTSFVGYEWTGAPMLNNQHRNVIFRNHKVTEKAISYFDADRPEELWARLDQECLDKNNGCEVLTIPHNSNLGGGTMFQPYTERRNPYTPELAAQRQRMEPLIEIYQHKGASECISSSNAPLASEDELCDFELVITNICTGAEDDAPDCKPLCSDFIFPIGGFSGICVEPSDFARSTLRQGLAEQTRIGVNPFKFGFIGSTDTHNATPGAVEEYNFQGHVGESDGTLENRIGIAGQADNELGQAFADIAGFASLKPYSPGGLAVVWAEQNSRDAIFNNMQSRETYATSGTRIITRFFGGWNLPEDLCNATDFVEQGYNKGVPMGSDLPLASRDTFNDPHPSPSFAVSAMMDAGTQNFPGTPLQRIQIIKGWEDQGETFEKVYEVAGDPDNGAGVNIDSCETYGSGFEQLCSVWQDPDFNPDQNAFYYARIVENPTCRWSRLQCNAAMTEQQLTCNDIDAEHPLAACCDGSIPDAIQERAWTSPIWYHAI
ncbi:MAG: DUF3604 domain-containing protein [Pseudomonadales bacterium]|nr:DUF3604 domain-containing protein [Pseudomonadales bacterium]